MSRPQKPPRRERVYRLDSEGAVETSVPVAELLEHLPLTCRYAPNMDIYRRQGMIVGAALGFMVVWLLLFAWIQAVEVMAVVFMALAGGIVGAPLGAILGFVGWPLFAPKPFWVVRRVKVVDDQGQESYQINPVNHSYLMAHAVPVDDVKENDPRGPKPAVHLGSTWWTIVQAVGYAMWFKPPSDRMSKLQTYSLWSIAGLLALALVFVIAITAD